MGDPEGDYCMCISLGIVAATAANCARVLRCHDVGMVSGSSMRGPPRPRTRRLPSDSSDGNALGDGVPVGVLSHP